MKPSSDMVTCQTTAAIALPSSSRARSGGEGGLVYLQLTACLTSFAILISSAFFNSLTANATGHVEPSSRLALSLKANIAYRSLNFAALRKKQTTLPSLLAYAGIPYHVLGVSSGAVFLTIS